MVKRSSSPRRAATARAWTGAVQTVEHALELYGAPVYVRKEIVHNKHVVEELASAGRDLRRGGDRGARGRDRGVLRSRRGARASTRTPQARELRTIDATCPLVTKVHVEARKFAARGLHDRARSATRATRRSRARWARRPTTSCSCETEEDVDALEVEDPERVAYITQTTLSVDETDAIIAACGSASRHHRAAGPTTSVTRPPTASSPSGRWRASATSCS